MNSRTSLEHRRTGLPSSRSGSTTLFRTHVSHRVTRSGDWESAKVKGRFFFSVESQPYKGLEYLIAAFRQIRAQCEDYRLIIAGSPENCERYWRTIREAIREDVQSGRVVLRAEFIPDDETEVYFKAADVLVLPYRDIYQSGVLFLGHSFGLPVLAADVGSLKDEIVEGKTGFIFRPEDPVDLAKAIERYFASDLYADLRQPPAGDTRLRDGAAFLGRGRSDDHERICRLASYALARASVEL